MSENTAVANVTAQRFMDLFDGLTRAHGVYTPGGTASDKGKLPSNAKTVHEPVTLDLVAAHIEGRQGLGLCPCRDDSTVKFGAIDIDIYEGLDHAKIARDLMALDLPLIVCRSKSGGSHCYLFTSQPVTAAAMQSKLRDIAAQLGHDGAEIFPKQTSLPADGFGSWINLPFFQGDTGTRYAVLPNGDALTLEQFLDLAESSRVNAAWFGNVGPGTRNPESAKAARATKKTFALPDVIGDGARNSTLTGLAGAMRRTGMSQDSILAALRQTNAEKCKPPLSDQDLETIAKSVGRYAPKEAGEAEEGLTTDLAKAIKTDSFFARDAGGLLYAFEDGVYKPTGSRVIERRVKELCKAWKKTKAWSPELATKVSEWIKVDAQEIWECPPLDVLNCTNGLLEVETRILRPHSPEHLSAIQIAAAFDPGAKCPEIEKFVKDVFPSDSGHLLFEIAAWLMLPNMSLQKSVLLIGEGANGKSIFLRLIETFLGRDNSSNLSLHRIEADKFSAARLVSKLVNIGTDLPTAQLTGTSCFKAITGGDTITAERKFSQSFEFRPFSRLLFSANSFPRSEDGSQGFFRRWVCIPFNRTFDEQSPDHVPSAVLNARLSSPAELSGLLNKAIDALPAIARGHFTESGSTRAALQEFRNTTDPMAVWLEQFTVEKADAMIPKDQLRSAYSQVCQEAGRPIIPDTQFTAALKRLRPRVTVTQRRVSGRVTRVFVGLGFVTRDPESGGGLFERQGA